MKNVVLLTFTTVFSLMCLIMLILFMIMAKDLNNKVRYQEIYIKELEWENTYCRER